MIPITSIQFNTEDAIDLVFIAEWYSSSSISAFLWQVNTLIDWLFIRDPFNKYRNKFNIYACPTVSNDDGISRLGWFPNWLTAINKDTFWNSHSNHNGTERLIYLDQTKYDTVLKPFIRQNFKKKTLVLVVCNDPMYAWWWQYTTDKDFCSIWLQTLATASWLFVPLFIHELWHSFCNLADEYIDDAYLASSPWKSYHYSRISWNASISLNNDRKRDHLYTEPQYILGSVYDISKNYRADNTNLMRALSVDISSPNAHFNIVQQSVIRDEIKKRISYNKFVECYQNNETISTPIPKNKNIRIHSDVTITNNQRVKSIFVAEWCTLNIPTWVIVQTFKVYNWWTINWLINIL